jgi:phosphatidate cytidylyltransferase
MKRVLTAAVLIPLVLAAVLWAPLWLFTVLVAVVALLAAREYLQIVAAYQVPAQTALTYIFFAVFFVTLGFAATHIDRDLDFVISMLLAGAAVVAIAPFFFAAGAMGQPELKTSLLSTGASSFGMAYICLPLGALVALRGGVFGWFWIVWLFVVVWSGDVFAYYVGRTIGRHLLAPRVSPKKTWEGTVASFVASIALGTVFYRALPALDRFQAVPALHLQHFTLPEWWHIALLAAVVNVAAQLGDLVESMMKRGAGLKDSGMLLPGHGGVLDRIDALLLAAPVLWYYAAFLDVSR